MRILRNLGAQAFTSGGDALLGAGVLVAGGLTVAVGTTLAAVTVAASAASVAVFAAHSTARALFIPAAGGLLVAGVGALFGAAFAGPCAAWCGGILAYNLLAEGVNYARGKEDEPQSIITKVKDEIDSAFNKDADKVVETEANYNESAKRWERMTDGINEWFSDNEGKWVAA